MYLLKKFGISLKNCFDKGEWLWKKYYQLGAY